MRRASVRATALLLAGGMALAGCASDDDGGDDGGSGGGGGGDLKIGLAYDTGGRGDRSFNDSAYEGVQNAIEEHGGDLQEFSPNRSGSDRAEGLANLADQGFDPVIAVGFNYGDVIADVAADFPDTTFAIIDSSVTDIGADNLTGIVFAEEQGSFLAGVAAALKSQTGQIGFVGGVESPLIEKFQAGYEAGARAANPSIVINSQYISPAGDFSGFNDPARGQILAQGMYDAGADIVYHAAGGSGIGVFQAAAAAGKLAIGVDSDQYNTVDDPALKNVILTSMLKRVDNGVSAFLDDYVSGDLEGGTDVRYDLESEGVGLSTTGGKIDDIMPQIEEFRQKIISGEITVPTTP